MADDDIQSLVAEWCAGNDKAGELLIEKFAPSLFRFCRYLTGNEHDAGDLAQECWIQFLASRQSFRGGEEGSVRSWLFSTARNKFLNNQRGAGRMRKRHNEFAARNYETAWETDSVTGKSTPTAVDPSPGPDGQAEDGELRNALNSLGEPCRTMLILKYFEEFDHQQIAEVLEISKSKVDHMSKKCLEMLKKKLQSGSGGGV